MTPFPSPVHARYVDRHQAGAVLAEHPAAREDRGDVVVLALPRGGVPVGFELWYADFSQTTDDEVRELLAASREAPSDARAHRAARVRHRRRRGRLARRVPREPVGQAER